MKEEIFEASLTPEEIQNMRGRPSIANKETSAYGSLDRSFEALKANLKTPTIDNERMWNLLRGCYDIHVHGGPSSTTQRLFDELDLAIHGCYLGQGGFVSKNHDSPSTRSIIIAQKAVDKWAEEHNKNKIQLFGGVVLNYAVGGLNPDAIISAYRLGGKYVWLPNLDSNHHRRAVGQGEGQGIDLIDENDKLVPKMSELLEMLVETDMILGTGHQSTKERLVVVREAVRMGINRIEITHVNFPITRCTPDQCKMFADMGAYIGIYALNCGIDYSWDDIMAIYKAVGPERIVLGSDGGHIDMPYPLEGMRRLIVRFLINGVPDKHIELMCKTNAYNLLH